MRHLIVTFILLGVCTFIGGPRYLNAYHDYNGMKCVKADYEVSKPVYDTLQNELNEYTTTYTQEAGYYESNYALGEVISMLPGMQLASIELVHTNGSNTFISSIDDTFLYSEKTYCATLIIFSIDSTLQSILGMKIPVDGIEYDYQNNCITMLVPNIESEASRESSSEPSSEAGSESISETEANGLE